MNVYLIITHFKANVTIGGTILLNCKKCIYPYISEVTA